jgi:hypothetical protein
MMSCKLNAEITATDSNLLGCDIVLTGTQGTTISKDPAASSLHLQGRHSPEEWNLHQDHCGNLEECERVCTCIWANMLLV